MKFEEIDCCGNGCANCVLNEKPKQNPSFKKSYGKANLIESYRKFILKSKKFHLNLNDVLELHFESESEAKEQYILEIPSGNHVMMRAPVFLGNENTKQLLRPYSPFFVDSINLEFQILVNLKPRGPMSEYITNMEEGSLVEFRGPIASVALAPCLPIIEEILENEDDMTSIIHLACFVDLEHVYFRRRLHDFGSYWNYNLRIYLTRQKCDNNECVKSGLCGDECPDLKKKLFYKEQVFLRRLTELELSNYVKTDDNHDSRFVIAGTRTFQNQLSDVIKSLIIGIDEKNICLL